MQINSEVIDGKGVLTLDGSLNAATVDAVRDQFHRLLEEHESIKQWILDARAIAFIDSAGLGMLIALLKRLAERGGDLHIAGLSKQTRVVFEITRSYKIFNLYETLEEALGQ